MKQLLLFQQDPIKELQMEVKSLREQSDKVRKSQYAKIGYLTKMYEETKHELETLKSAMTRTL